MFAIEFHFLGELFCNKLQGVRADLHYSNLLLLSVRYHALLLKLI